MVLKASCWMPVMLPSLVERTWKMVAWWLEKSAVLGMEVEET